MRLRIVRPVPPQLEDFDLTNIHFAAVHDLQSPLSDLLIVLGYAIPADEPVAAALDRAPDRRVADRRRRTPRKSKAKKGSKRR